MPPWGGRNCGRWVFAETFELSLPSGLGLGCGNGSVSSRGRLLQRLQR